MAWYYGTYSCGHDGRVQIYGPTKDRQWKADREFSKLCPDCYKEYLQKQREEETKKAMEKAKEMELPPLRGTEKQVAWAERIRQEVIEKFDEELKLDDNLLMRRYRLTRDQLLVIKHFILENRVSASYYIEARHNGVFSFVEMEKKAALEAETRKIDREMEEEIKRESTVYPENVKEKAVAEIKVQPNQVLVMYPRNERFRSIVKELGYQWNGEAWAKEIKETTGPAEERAAELGNKLLNAGFPICILDPIIRQRAIAGEYEPECRRWIFQRKGTDKLAINWTDGSDLYRKAISLPSAKWSRPSILVNVEYYEEVEEFAELYGFRFTSAARKLIETHIAQKEKAQVVTPAPARETEEKDGLQDILDSEAVVLDDLKD